jgi:hypothetical protein
MVVPHRKHYFLTTNASSLMSVRKKKILFIVGTKEAHRKVYAPQYIAFML